MLEQKTCSNFVPDLLKVMHRIKIDRRKKEISEINAWSVSKCEYLFDISTLPCGEEISIMKG